MDIAQRDADWRVQPLTRTTGDMDIAQRDAVWRVQPPSLYQVVFLFLFFESEGLQHGNWNVLVLNVQSKPAIAS